MDFNEIEIVLSDEGMCIEEVFDDHIGICTECQEVHFGVEPDAEVSLCQTCGKNAVQGMQTLLIGAL